MIMRENDDSTSDPRQSMISGGQFVVFFAIEFIIAFGFFATAGTLSGKYLNLFAIVFGMVAAAAYLVLVMTRRIFKVRLAIDIAAVVFVLFGYVIPEYRADVQQKTEERARVVRLRAEDEADKIEFNAWLAAMKQSTNHGPPGEVPPMLTVKDDGTTVRVQNNLDHSINVALARVREDSNSPGGWKGCGLYTDDGGGRKYSWVIAPKQSITYVTWQECGAAYRDAPIEYRVGKRPPESGWWSDSAFAKQEGREFDGIR